MLPRRNPQKSSALASPIPHVDELSGFVGIKLQQPIPDSY